jgi:histone chaperone ASF1
VLLTCSYKEHEFVRVGYFVNNDYTDPELRENPPAVPQFDKVFLPFKTSKINKIIF